MLLSFVLFPVLLLFLLFYFVVASGCYSATILPRLYHHLLPRTIRSNTDFVVGLPHVNNPSCYGAFGTMPPIYGVRCLNQGVSVLRANNDSTALWMSADKWMIVIRRSRTTG